MTPEEILNKAIEQGDLINEFGRDVVEKAKKNALKFWYWDDEELTIEMIIRMLREDCREIIEQEEKEKEKKRKERILDLQYELAEEIRKRVGGRIYISASSTYLDTYSHKIRISDHMARPTYQKLYGEADIEISVGEVPNPDADYFLPIDATEKDISELADIIELLIDYDSDDE